VRLSRAFLSLSALVARIFGCMRARRVHFWVHPHSFGLHRRADARSECHGARNEILDPT